MMLTQISSGPATPGAVTEESPNTAIRKGGWLGSPKTPEGSNSVWRGAGWSTAYRASAPRITAPAVTPRISRRGTIPQFLQGNPDSGAACVLDSRLEPETALGFGQVDDCPGCIRE